MKRSRAGFTLVEVLIALTLVGLLIANVSMVMQSGSRSFQLQSSLAELETQADRTLDRIALALMASSRESIDPSQQSPFHTSVLSYEQSLGVQNGNVVTGPVERIEMIVQNGQVMWRERPDDPSERSVVWSNWVSSFLQGEEPNGVDDNGNGLIDETGLSFEVVGERVSIRLTLERLLPDKSLRQVSRETVVTCRN